VGDAAFLWQQSGWTWRQYKNLSRWFAHQEWFQGLCAAHERVFHPDSALAGKAELDFLAQQLSWHDAEAPEPEWMDRLPREARTYIRHWHLLTEGFDPLCGCIRLPYAGFEYLLKDWSLASETCQALGIHRLGRIGQLGFLREPSLQYVVKFNHTRLLHVYDTQAIATLIAENCGMLPELARTLEVAALSHDVLTPAGGDSTKLVNRQAFDEDEHFREIFGRDSWQSLQARWELDSGLLDRTVRGEGLLGRILDLADKFYTARDAEAYLNHMPFEDRGHLGYQRVADLVSKYPMVCGIWQTATLQEGRLVIADAPRLVQFLKLRALMFRHLYYHPRSRIFECLVGKGIAKYLYHEGKLTRKELLTQGDDWLEWKISNFLETPLLFNSLRVMQHTRIEEFSDHSAALRRAAQFDGDKSILVVIDRHVNTTKSGIQRFPVLHRGRVAMLSEIYPQAAAEIEAIINIPKTTRLYFFNATEDFGIGRGLRKRIKRILRSLRN